jgi:uncharacterized membrane protein (DUF485 family)
MTCGHMNQSVRRYTIRMMVVMTFYVLFIALAAYEFGHMHLAGWVAYTLAALPAIPAIAIFIIAGIYLTDEKDEFQRNVFIQAMLWGSGITLSFSTLWGFLDLFVGLPHFDIYLLFPIFWGVTGIASGFIKLRYK